MKVVRMFQSLPLPPCASVVSMKENPDKKKQYIKMFFLQIISYLSLEVSCASVVSMKENPDKKKQYIKMFFLQIISYLSLEVP